MRIYLNGTSKEYKASLKLALQEEGLLEKRGIAVAVNNQVIPKAVWESYKLSENDKILVIRASQGG